MEKNSGIGTAETMISAHCATLSGALSRGEPPKAVDEILQRISDLKKQLEKLQGGRDDLD